MFEKNIVEATTAEYAWTAVYLSKKNGSLRLYKKYLKLNVVTFWRSFSMWQLDKFHDSLGTPVVLTSM